MHYTATPVTKRRIVHFEGQMFTQLSHLFPNPTLVSSLQISSDDCIMKHKGGHMRHIILNLLQAPRGNMQVALLVNTIPTSSSGNLSYNTTIPLGKVMYQPVSR